MTSSSPRRLKSMAIFSCNGVSSGTIFESLPMSVTYSSLIHLLGLGDIPLLVGGSAKLSDFGLALQMVMQLRNTLKQVIYTLIAMFMDMGKSEQSLVNIFTLQHKV
ncbi:hypothetical protein LWI28_001467 [Acer negundo]|uniref:Uncharacterized protein n=1 Tax=Acer negundo TaxID=4023 RepID=A0AAD5ICE1_ACENE|nr:hypothetical protein LWI28_001467 [Acer negundo]